MITRIEIDGFKTFRDFKLELAPLQVIVGPNGAGKSNLFDALLLLSHLTDVDLRTAFQRMRGEVGELFTIQPHGESVDRMRLAVELLVDRQVQDSWGAQASIKFTRLRYELELSRRQDRQGLERLYVDHESLRPIARGEDRWIRRHGLVSSEYWLPPLTGGRSAPFISTTQEHDKSTILLHQDGHGGRKSSVAARMERTILSGVSNTEFRHAFAVHEEIRSWRFLQLNPEVLRKPSSMVSPQYMESDGRYLSSALARMQADDPMLLADVSRDLSNLVPGVIKIGVEADKARDECVIWAKTEDSRLFTSRVLSDGTLRMLALVALKNDPEYRGVLCVEEPENGVHPFRLKHIAHLLHDLATDFSDPDQVDMPLRQFLANTHSPVFISQPDILPHVLFAHTVTRMDPAHSAQPERVTRMIPVVPPTQLPFDLEVSEEDRAYTLEEVLNYLDNIDLGEARHLLARNSHTYLAPRASEQT